MRHALLAVLAAAALAAGCGDSSPTPGVKPDPPEAQGSGHAVVPGRDPTTIPGHPPLGGAMPGAPLGGAMPGAPHGGAAPAAGLEASHFPAPEGWQAETPSSGMRLLQYRLPRADGDAEDGEVAVFTRIMGSAEANIERWRGQFSNVVHGKDRLEEVVEGVKGKVHLLDITGVYGGQMGGPVAAAHGEGSGKETRMIAAVVEHPGGTFYVKAQGPPGTLGKWEASVRSFVMDAAKR